MSCHRSQRSINLHHDQVNAGRTRHWQRQVDRAQDFLSTREQLRLEYDSMLVCGFICFAYTAIATAVYLGPLIRA